MAIFDEKIEIRELRPLGWLRLPSVRWDASFARNLAPDYCRFNAVQMNIKNTMKKKKQKGNPNDLRTTVIRQKEPRYPQHIHSLFSRFSLQPPFIEVLSGLLRAAYWPLVFSFSSFSGLFWPGPFFPNFRQWIPKRCKGVHFSLQPSFADVLSGLLRAA